MHIMECSTSVTNNDFIIVMSKVIYLKTVQYLYQWGTVPTLIRPPPYYGYFMLAQTKAQSDIFLFKEPL